MVLVLVAECRCGDFSVVVANYVTIDFVVATYVTIDFVVATIVVVVVASYTTIDVVVAAAVVVNVVINFMKICFNNIVNSADNIADNRVVKTCDINVTETATDTCAGYTVLARNALRPRRVIHDVIKGL